MAFSTRLAELRIENLVLGYDTAIPPFLQALSSASGLRDLRIISVKTFRDPSLTHEIQPLPPVAFPNLQLLPLQDLRCNTLQILIPMIAPGSYRLTLSLGYGSLHANLGFGGYYDVAPELNDFDKLCRVLEHTPVHALMLSGHKGAGIHTWLKGSELCKLLEIMPTLKTLKMDYWIFDPNDWECLKRSHDAQMDPQDHPFPLLENLYFSSARIPSTKGLVEMVASHSIQEMVLGATIYNVLRPGETSVWRPLPESSPVVRQLKANVPTFHLAHNDFTPPEFYSDSWRLC